MYSKGLIWLGVFVGSTIGGLVPYLWGASMFSFSPILFSAIGGVLGIWAAVKLSNYFG